MSKRKLGFLTHGIFWRLLFVVVGVLFVDVAMAALVTLTNIVTSVTHSTQNVAKIIQDVALVTGVGFVLASFFKFHQHKLNPTQVPLSQGVTLLVIGGALSIFPALIGTASKGVFGTTTAGSIAPKITPS